MKKAGLIAGALALVTSGTALAQFQWSSAVRVTQIQVSEVVDVGSAGVWVTFNNNPFPNQSCPKKDGHYRLGGSQDNIDKMTTVALSAKQNALPLRVFWDGGCNGDWPVVRGLWLQ